MRKMKKILAGILSGILCLSLFTGTVKAEGNDATEIEVVVEDAVVTDVVEAEADVVETDIAKDNTVENDVIEAESFEDEKDAETEALEEFIPEGANDTGASDISDELVQSNIFDPQSEIAVTKLEAPQFFWWTYEEDTFYLNWEAVENADRYYIVFYENGERLMGLTTGNLKYSPFTSSVGSQYTPNPGSTYSVIAMSRAESPEFQDSDYSDELAVMQIGSDGIGRVNGKPIQGSPGYSEEGVTISGGKYYIDGEFDPNKNGFATYNGGKFYIVKGLVATAASGLKQDPVNRDDWYFCANGQVVLSKTGLVQYPAGEDNWFYVENGKLDTTYNGFVSYNGGLFLVARGRILRTKSGLAQDPNKRDDWYFLANGQALTGYTGLALYDNAWFYVYRGKLGREYIVMVDYNGATFACIRGGIVDYGDLIPADQVIAWVNYYRVNEGVVPLIKDSLVSAAAQVRAVEIDDTFSHSRPDGSSCFTVLSEVGASAGWKGENIAKGQYDAKQVMDTWMGSSGHRANILHESFRHIGVGFFNGNSRCWTQMFTD